MLTKNTYVVLLFVLFSSLYFGQDGKKSSVINTIAGKKFYIHTVEKNQSLYAIAKIYNVDLNSLLAENLNAIEGIKAGEELKIPISLQAVETVTSPSDFAKYLFHKVEKKETIYSICSKYRITEAQLFEMNPEIKNVIRETQLLKVGLKDNQTKLDLKNEILIGNSISIRDTTKTPQRPRKKKYNVGIFLPIETTALELEELNANENIKKFPKISALTCDFYEGYLKALDSLNDENFEINTVVFNVSESDSNACTKIISKSEFKSLDFIIGPWYTSSFQVIANAAKNLGIASASLTIQQNKILFKNSLTSKIIPSKNSITELLAKFTADSLHQNNILIVNNDKPKEQNTIRIFKNTYNSTILTKFNDTDTIKEVKSLAVLKSAFAKNKKNIVVLLTENTAYLTDFFTQLGLFVGDKKEITIIGNYNWMSNENLDAGYYNRYSFICATHYFIDKENAEVNKLWKQYRNLFFSDPEDIYFQSYDMSFYYLNRLKEEGADFYMTLDKNKFKGNVMNFDFFSPNIETGFENKGGKILKVQDNKIINAN